MPFSEFHLMTIYYEIFPLWLMWRQTISRLVWGPELFCPFLFGISPLTSHIFFLRHVQTNTQLKTQWDPFAELQSSFYIECPLFHCFALQFVAALNAISVFSTRQYWWSLYEFFLLVPWKLSLSSKLMKMQGSPCLFLISLESHSSMLLVVRCLKIVCSYICSCV